MTVNPLDMALALRMTQSHEHGVRYKCVNLHRFKDGNMYKPFRDDKDKDTTKEVIYKRNHVMA